MSPTGNIGRNDPCPCGSGRKYKQCCLKTGARAPAAAPALPSEDSMLRDALGHQRAGRLMSAADLYRRILQRHPRSVAALSNLGQVLGTMGDFDEGIAMLERAASVDGKRRETHVMLADLLFQSGRAADALRSAGRAATIDPGYARAHAIAARCHDRLNDLDKAAAAGRRALAAEPGNPEASLLLARIERRRGDLEAARAHLQAMLADAAVRGMPRIQALHELGTVLDRLGDADAAYEAFADAGRITAKTPTARSIDGEVWSRRVARYRAGLRTEVPGRFTAEDLDDGLPSPAFLVGFPRSGTTMTEQVLAAHPALVTADEQPVLREALEHVAPDGNDDLSAALETMDRGRAIELRRVYREKVAAVVGDAPGGATIVDKLPLNIVYAALIDAVFPDARVLVALRDPRDVCLSCFMQSFGLNSAMINFLSLERTAKFYAEVMSLWLHTRSIITVPFLEIRYEDTVVDLETQARRMLDLLAVPWDERCLSFHEAARQRQISTPSYIAVTEPVRTRAVARWRRYERQMAPVLETLQPFVEALGYES